MAAKAFYVSRTETEGQPSGAATLNRADAPQLLKIVPVDSSTGNPDPATPVDNMIYATEADDQEILLTSDTVQSGDLNPVTSDAVYNAIQSRALSLLDYSNAVSLTVVNFPYTATTNGVVILSAYSASQNIGVTAGDILVSIDNIVIATLYNQIQISGSNVAARPDYLYLPVSVGDIISFNNYTDLRIRNGNFVPYKN